MLLSLEFMNQGRNDMKDQPHNPMSKRDLCAGTSIDAVVDIKFVSTFLFEVVGKKGNLLKLKFISTNK